MNTPSDKSGQKPENNVTPDKESTPNLRAAEVIARAVESIKRQQTYKHINWDDLVARTSINAALYPELLKSLKLSQTATAPLKLGTDIAKLQEDIRETLNTLKLDAKKKADEQKIKELEEKLDALTSKQDIQHLLNSVSPEAHKLLEEDESFQKLFSQEEETNSFVVSVDIRRSTELMLKARSPKQFSQFITSVCDDLDRIFKNCWGVVDKFTGDGMLAFFPDFFSGTDAGYHALKAATDCIDSFNKAYRTHRSTFNCVLRDIGLGIGIDYGKVHIVRMSGALTIVGQPVVYACRLSASPPNSIYLNQPAYEIIDQKYADISTIKETTLDIKHDGPLVCYEAVLTKKAFKPSGPDWFKRNS